MKMTSSYTKENCPGEVSLVKCGRFYRCYENDAFIVSYLAGYKINSSAYSDMVGFPKESLKNVVSLLARFKVNYKVLEVNGIKIDVLEEREFEEENQFEEIYNKAKRYIILKRRVERLFDEIMRNIERDEIEKVIIKLEETVKNEI